MTTTTHKSEIAEDVREKLGDCYLLVQTPQVAAIVWRRMLHKNHRDRLGGDFEDAYGRYRTVRMWQKLFGVSPARAVLDISLGADLISSTTYRWLLQETGEVFAPGDGRLLAAVETGALVLLQSPPTAFWNGKKIELNWQKKMRAPWEFFWEISVKAKRGLVLDCRDVGEGISRKAAENRKSHLLLPDAFPADLGELFIAVGNGAYKLDVPPERIRIFELYHETTLVEFSGWRPAYPTRSR